MLSWSCISVRLGVETSSLVKTGNWNRIFKAIYHDHFGADCNVKESKSEINIEGEKSDVYSMDCNKRATMLWVSLSMLMCITLYVMCAVPFHLYEIHMHTSNDASFGAPCRTFLDDRKWNWCDDLKQANVKLFWCEQMFSRNTRRVLSVLVWNDKI